MEKLIHTINPIFNHDSRVLILGSFPSPLSRKNNMFYGNPRNRFWEILSAIFNEKIPQNNSGKIAFLLDKKIALWDVVKECEIHGASDSSITNVVPNDLDKIFSIANIRATFTTGQTATKLYTKLFNKTSIYLPSPSPANFGCNFDTMVQKYRAILEYLK